MSANALSTSITLLQRLREPNQPAAWERFARLYTPILVEWARRQGFHEADAADLIQDLFLKLVRVLPAYAREPGQSFRNWLHRLLVNQGHDFRRRKATRPLPGIAELGGSLEDIEAHSGAEIEEDEYRRLVVRRALELIRPEFGEVTWTAFEHVMLEGRPAGEVAGQLGITTNAVYLTRHRVLTRLRREIDGFLE